MMTKEEVIQLIKDFSSSDISIIVAASQRFTANKGNIPTSLFQQALDLYLTAEMSCCVQKVIDTDNFNKLCDAISKIK